MSNYILTPEDQLRQVQPKWNKALVVASIAISFLGTFTSTQLMCHARASYQFGSVFAWGLFGSLTFGFGSIWGLHEVAMLAYEFDLPIGVDAPLTVLSALLAVSFTFAAMAGDLLYDRYRSGQYGRKGRHMHRSRSKRVASDHLFGTAQDSSSTPLLTLPDTDEESTQVVDYAPMNTLSQLSSLGVPYNGNAAAFVQQSSNHTLAPASSNDNSTEYQRPESCSHSEDGIDEGSAMQQSSTRTSSVSSNYRRLSTTDSNSGSLGLRHALGFIQRDRTLITQNPFIATANLLYHGMTPRNITKGFIWSIAISSMHWVGIFALKIPNGYYKFHTGLLVLSAFISWIVCTVGFILMSRIETHLSQQLLFSIIATGGVAAMHFTGMAATTFWSTEPASTVRGFPPALAGTVVGVAFLTCIVANVLLSHSATLSRNKLAEIVWTRKELFKSLAAKEHAEAAARARSEFVSIVAHEVRTPLHHLQGYSDLLGQTELTEEGRALLTAIQRATKTLSLLTNNVLDWSKFEGTAHGEYRPTAVDIRVVCESIITLMPNLEDDSTVETYVVVGSDVPKTLHLDESWVHRILMNLVSNALKFTTNGYILLLLEVRGDNLVAIVEDTGCGLDPNFIPDMWTPFKQGEVRGSARGTGLGLSIIQQLLHRMSGSIDVESRFQHTEGIGPERSGTKFIVTMPVHPAVPTHLVDNNEGRPKIAIFTINGRSLEGIRSAWNSFGFDVTCAHSVIELGETRWKYVWAEPSFFTNNKSSWAQLLSREELLILIPYDTHDSLDSLPGLLKARNIVLLQKPLLWHNFDRRVAATLERRRTSAPSQALRFASEVEVLNVATSETISPSVEPFLSKNHQYTILLVEDNPINRKLGAKMLHALSYQILFANDGVEALSMLTTHDAKIDCVLMDQSMPNMDGVTATRMIRMMEKQGKLRPSRPILAVTAVVNSEAKEEFRQAGANDFLAKPLSLERLRDVLRLYLPSD